MSAPSTKSPFATKVRPFTREQTESRTAKIVGMRVNALTYERAVERFTAWARSGESRYVCVATVHMVMEGYDNRDFQEIVNNADAVTSDGMPLVWGLRLLGHRDATRVYGPDLTIALCETAAREGIPVGFYGSSEQVLDDMIMELQRRFPTLPVVYRQSPPFRPLSEAESAREIEEIAASGARMLFVGLGCPKQERWMAAHRGQLDTVMLGVGAAFDFIAGSKRHAPNWMKATGTEWVFRLVTEPRRLWRRYVYHNPRFVLLFAREFIGR